MRRENCSAPGCENAAVVEARLYDVYVDDPNVLMFDERDFTCPFLCDAHVRENETRAKGERKPRGSVRYPFTNQHQAQGFTIYRPLQDSEA